MPYLLDLCDANSEQCYVDKFFDFMWKNQDSIRNNHIYSQDDILAYYASFLKDFDGVDVNAIKALNQGDKDKYNTDERIRKAWKYGAGIGVYGTPNVFINDVQLANVPDTKQGWIDLINSIAASPYSESDSQFLQS